jgi:hypothetical protein
VKFETVTKTIRAMIPDALMIAGSALIAYGAYQIFEPAGFIVGGALACYGGYQAAQAS